MAASKNPAPAPRLTAAERRAQLAELAARRFQEFGYHHVSLADVAADAGVTAPAVYRHFRNKQDLLAGAISSGLDAVEAVLARTADDALEDVVSAIAELIEDRRYLWNLLQREARFLDPQPRSSIEAQLDRITDEFVRHLKLRRPKLAPDEARLLVTAATSALASPSLPRSAPRWLVTRALASAAMAVLLATLPDKAEAPDAASIAESTDPKTTDNRRTRLVDTAIDLFFRRGYAGVSLDDIGAAIGIAGPSIYHHFTTKADILVAAFARATDRLADQHTRRSNGQRTPSLAELVGIYTDFCLHNRQLVGIYVWETMNLPPDAQRRIRTALRARVSEWSVALQAENHTVDQPTARVRVHAALTVIDDMVRLGHLHQRPRIAAEIRKLAIAALTADPDAWLNGLTDDHRPGQDRRRLR